MTCMKFKFCTTEGGRKIRSKWTRKWLNEKNRMDYKSMGSSSCMQPSLMYATMHVEKQASKSSDILLPQFPVSG